MGGACRTHGGDEKCTQISVGKLEGKRPLRRHGRRWDNNITMDIGY